MKKKEVKRLLSFLLVGALCLSSLMASTLAWTSFSQRAQNMVRTPGTAQQQGLEIRKTVQNDHGGPLTAVQLAQQFTFTVTFSDGGSYSFSIDDGPQQVLESGGSLLLRHGQLAFFHNIPVGVTFTVVEAPVEGFRISSTNHQATFTGEHIVAKFINTALHGRITVNKTVVGNAPNSDELFGFTASIGDETHTFSLRHGEYWISDYFPVGTPFSVDEHDAPPFLSSPADGHSGYIAEGNTYLPFVNTYIDDTDKPGAVRISKRVAGGESEESFSFTIVFSNLPDEEVMVLVNGQPFLLSTTQYIHTFTLAHEDALLLEQLPAGVRFVVTEAPAEGFVTSISIGGTVVEGNQISAGVAADYTIEIEFINTMDDAPEYNLVVTKTIEGEFPAADYAIAFRFRLAVQGEQPYYFYLRHGESRSFRLPAGAFYTVTELVPEHYWLLRSVNGTGTATRETIYAEFVNQYRGEEPPLETTVATTTASTTESTSSLVTTTEPASTTQTGATTTTTALMTTTQPTTTNVTTQAPTTAQSTTRPVAATTMPGTTASHNRPPQTGVEDNLWLWLTLLAASLSCLAFLSHRWLIAGRKYDKHLQNAIDELFDSEE